MQKVFDRMLSQRNVVIIDDDKAIRRSTASLLEIAGYRLRVFESGDAFLANYIPGDADCIVMDVRMPGTDGLGVLRALNSQERMPPTLLLTGYGAIPEAVEAMKLGAADFLEKPYPALDLIQAIDRAMADGPRRETGVYDPEAVAKIGALSERQVQVLRGVLEGRPNKIIAYELGLSIRTVESYRAQMLEKLGVRSVAEAVRVAIAAGMLDSGRDGSPGRTPPKAALEGTLTKAPRSASWAKVLH